MIEMMKQRGINIPWFWTDYNQMTPEDQARLRGLFKAIREDYSQGHRYRNLAWGFIRGFRYRRIERSHHAQKVAKTTPHWDGFFETPDGCVFEHNFPSLFNLTSLLGKHIPEIADDIKGWRVRDGSPVQMWLADREGAIPVPVREKKPYVRPEVA